MKKIIFATVLFVATSTAAFSQNAKVQLAADGAKSAPVVKSDVPKSGPILLKPVPQELLMNFIKYNALNQAIADIKQRDGITALEGELQKQGQDLLALAAKDGFHFDSVTQSFVENRPATAPAASATPSKK